jgi:uncharacterized protein YodC (DUF2158 family)
MPLADGFTVGELVQLRSGGPVMTVEALDTGHGDAEDSIRCFWFAGAKLHKAWFSPATLAPADHPAPQPGS